MAPHSSALAWRIPWTEEPGRLQSMGSRRVGHDQATSLSLFTFMHWRRKWQPTPEFLTGESQGRGSLVGCRLWGRTESDTAEATQQQQHFILATLISSFQTTYLFPILLPIIKFIQVFLSDEFNWIYSIDALLVLMLRKMANLYTPCYSQGIFLKHNLVISPP